MTRDRRRAGRAMLAGVDPGLVRLESAAVAVAAVLLAVGVLAAVRAALDPQLPVTIVLFGAVLAMFGNIAVKDATLSARRVTTALMAVPAAIATVTGTLIAPYHVVADVVIVLVTVFAVWVRRFGPRADALGMASFLPFYSTQFFGAKPEQVPWLVVAAVIGLGCTLLVRGFLLPGRPERTVRRVVRAFDSRAHAVVLAVDALLTASAGGGDAAVTRSLHALRHRRDRLHSTALQVENELERLPADDDPGQAEATRAVSLRTFDAELALERLAIAARHIVRPAGDDGPFHAGAYPADVADTLAHLLDATDPASDADAAAHAARAAAAAPTDTGRYGEVLRAAALVGDVLASTPPTPDPGGPDPDAPDDTPADAGAGTPAKAALRITTRNAAQVGAGVAAAIAVAELVAPQRWYWAVLTVFVLYNGTQSRGEVLGRGWMRLLGTLGGVVAGAALASLVGGNTAGSLAAMFGCLFLALYLAPVSPAMLAFFITVVLALLYGLLGQFGLQVLGLRLVETLIGAACGAVAAFVVLPKRSDEAVADAVDAAVAAMDAVLTAVLERSGGPGEGATAHARTRSMHAALATVRQRIEVKEGPVPRARSALQDLLRTVTVVDHYLRALTRLAARVPPAELSVLAPAVARTRANLAALAALCPGRPDRADGGGTAVVPSDPLLADLPGADDGTDVRAAADLLGRVDRAVVATATNLGATSGVPATSV